MIKYLLLLLPILLLIINWFFLKINMIVMRKVGVSSCYEPESEKNMILGKVSLFVQKFGKPQISERLNSKPRLARK